MSKAETTSVDKFTTRYDLPGGVTVLVRQPTNRIRRLLAENPDERVQFMMESIAAGCIKELTLPKDYSEDHPDGAKFNYEADDLKETFKRYDPLTLQDQQAFTTAFESQNLPTKAMVEAIVDAIKQRKLDKPGK